MITIGGEEAGAGKSALRHTHAESTAVERVAAVEVGDAQVKVTPTGACERSRGGRGRRGEERREIEALRGHGEFAVGGERPVGARTVDIELETVAIGIAEVEGFADAVVGGSGEFHVGVGGALQPGGECGTGRKQKCGVKESGGLGRGRGRGGITGESEDRGRTRRHGEIGLGRGGAGGDEAELARVVVDAPGEIGDAEMDGGELK